MYLFIYLFALGGTFLSQVPNCYGQGMIPFGQLFQGMFQPAKGKFSAEKMACHQAVDMAKEPMAAVPCGFFKTYPGFKEPDPICTEACVQVSANGKTQVVPVRDACCTCQPGQIFLSMFVYQMLGIMGPAVGMWQFVPCSGSSPPPLSTTPSNSSGAPVDGPTPPPGGATVMVKIGGQYISVPASDVQSGK